MIVYIDRICLEIGRLIGKGIGMITVRGRSVHIHAHLLGFIIESEAISDITLMIIMLDNETIGSRICVHVVQVMPKVIHH